MAAFTPAQLQNAVAAALDYFVRGDSFLQTTKRKPLMDDLIRGQQAFPGAREFYSTPVKGDISTTIQGFENDDEVSYSQPNNLRRAVFPIRNLHCGISFTHDELMRNGIAIRDSVTGESAAPVSGAAQFQLTNILRDKVADMAEGWARDFNTQLWLDGAQDPKELVGVTAYIRTAPTANAIVAGLDQVANPWWQNRVRLNVVANASNAADNELIQAIDSELLNLRLYDGGFPTKGYAGRDIIDQLRRELRAKGTYTDTGFSRDNPDLSAPDRVRFNNTTIIHDPTLDDLGWSKRLYLLDLNNIKLMPVQGQDRVTHTPARPENRYVFYRAMTWAGTLCVRMRRSSGLITIA